MKQSLKEVKNFPKVFLKATKLVAPWAKIQTQVSIDFLKYIYYIMVISHHIYGLYVHALFSCLILTCD